jgi:hypothetical protein
MYGTHRNHSACMSVFLYGESAVSECGACATHSIPTVSIFTFTRFGFEQARGGALWSGRLTPLRERRGTPRHADLFCTSSSPVHSLDLPEIARRRTPLSPAAGYPAAGMRGRRPVVICSREQGLT